MARFDRNGVSFDYPDSWRGLSITSVNKPVPWEEPDVCNILVSQEPLSDGESIDTRTRLKLMTVAKEMPHFKYLESRDIEIAGRRATVVAVSYGGEAAPLEQRIMAVECRTPSGRAAIVFSAVSTVANKKENFGELAEIMQSFRFT